jgi:hypothetical protein
VRVPGAVSIRIEAFFLDKVMMRFVPIIQGPEPTIFLFKGLYKMDLLGQFQELQARNAFRRFGKPDAGHTLYMHHTSLHNYVLFKDLSNGL